MSPDKRDDSRPGRRWSKREQQPTSRRGREHWVVRWIGAAKRRASKPVETSAVAASSARIIKLSWADTYGRSAQAGPVVLPRPAGMTVRLVPLLR